MPPCCPCVLSSGTAVSWPAVLCRLRGRHHAGCHWPSLLGHARVPKVVSPSLLLGRAARAQCVPARSQSSATHSTCHRRRCHCDHRIVITVAILHMPTMGAIHWKVLNWLVGTMLGCAAAYLQLALAFLINGLSWSNTAGKQAP